MCNFWKKIPIEKLSYWNVEDQEPYFSYKEASIRRKKKLNLFPTIVCPYPLIRIYNDHFFKIEFKFFKVILSIVSFLEKNIGFKYFYFKIIIYFSFNMIGTILQLNFLQIVLE